MTPVTFDTLKFVHRLLASGFDQAQAEAVAEAFAAAQGEADPATKRDLREVELSLKHETALTRDYFDTRLLESENRMIKWGMALALGQIAIIAALVKLL